MPDTALPPSVAGMLALLGLPADLLDQAAAPPPWLPDLLARLDRLEELLERLEPILVAVEPHLATLDRVMDRLPRVFR